MTESLRVLLVKDNVDAQTKQRQDLADSGFSFDVVTAAAASKLLQDSLQQVYQAVVVDCEDFSGAGDKLLSQLGSNRYDLPVVVVDKDLATANSLRERIHVHVSRESDYIALLSKIVPNKLSRENIGTLRVQSAFENAEHAMLMVDAESLSISEANLKACELLEAPEENLLRLPVSDFFAADGNLKLGSFLRTVVRDRDQGQKSIALTIKSQTQKRLELCAKFIQIESGSFLLLTLADTSEKYYLEKAVIQAEKLASVGLLASSIAHELRNPLNIIETARYYLQTFLEEPNSDILAKLDIIGKNVKRSSSIISNLLEFASPAAQKREFISLAAITDNTVALLGKELVAKNIELKLDLTKGLSTVFNKDALKQVLLNLVLNAIQAMPEGGKLGISAQRTRGDWLAIRISDTGVGIAKKHLARIFTPFFTTKKDQEGTGLGLYITHLLVEREGGKISVESHKSKGTTFTVMVPEAAAGPAVCA